MLFKDFNFNENLLDGLDAMSFAKATPIQEQAIPQIMAGKDLIACAQTGTGKTAAFLLPIIDKLIKLPEEKRHLNTLIIAPTRELAIQIDQQVEGLSYYTGISSIPIYGGGDGEVFVTQKRALEQGADIVIATPGRLISLLATIKTDFSQLQHLILDEADRMLDMGFLGDILRIISFLPAHKQSILFSATMPPEIRKLAGKILQSPEEINIAISKPAAGILQQAYVCFNEQKLPILQSLLKDAFYKSIIIFASSREKVKEIEIALQKLKLDCKGFHSDLGQSEREQLMNLFKGKKLRILIGTDIISRGIDVEGIDLVINFDCPGDPEDYIHRIGRTARAENTGRAITFINPADQRKFFRIESLIGTDIEKLPIAPSLGEVPTYNPQKSGGGGKKNFGKKPGGKKPFFKKRPPSA